MELPSDSDLHARAGAGGASTVLRPVQTQGMREAIAARRRYGQDRVQVRRIGVDGIGVSLARRRGDAEAGIAVDQEQAVGGLWVATVAEQDAAALAVNRRAQREGAALSPLRDDETRKERLFSHSFTGAGTLPSRRGP